ncbi:MAG: nuclear transport factor 2 family protein [Ferruginibacter sp.]
MKKAILIFMILISSLSVLHAQSKKETAVANAVEQLRKAMVDADSLMLDKLTSSQLSYGHSGGSIETKQEFIRKITSGKSDFVSIELKDQTISISHKTAIVRHLLNAVTNDNNKPGEVHLKILLVFQKEHGLWKMLARQAVKVS